VFTQASLPGGRVADIKATDSSTAAVGDGDTDDAGTATATADTATADTAEGSET
jgi:hypothetical protein